jgi:arylsulfatase A-like enzyme
MVRVAAVVALLLLASAVVASNHLEDSLPQPHIVLLVADDFGWANAGWHRPEGWDEVRTPRMNELVSHGIELNRAYQYKFCSPSRSSLQSGRLPVHVNFVNADPAVHNPADPVSGFAGIPPAMTGIAEHLKHVGYLTHFIGKWDCGMATPSHLPIARGYDSSLHYFHHANDYFTEKTHNVSDTCPHDVYPMVGGGCFTDMWDGASPAIGQNGTAPPNGTASHQSVGYPVTGPEEHYEEYKFKQRALGIVAKHPVNDPLFLCYCFHIVHEPLQVPQAYYAAFDGIKDDYLAMGLHHRRIYHAMVSYMDSAVGDVVDLLRSSKKQSMWNETLMVFQTDNGGPSFAGGLPTANNYPHKGTKSSNWSVRYEIASTQITAFSQFFVVCVQGRWNSRECVRLWWLPANSRTCSSRQQD